MLRELLVMFMVIICFAAAVTAMAVLSHHGSRLLEKTQQEVTRQNELMLKRVSHETN